MKILITGGLGVNGVAAARALVVRGLRPVLMDIRDDASLARDILDQVDLAIVDVTDRDGLERVVRDRAVTHIAHLAAAMPDAAEADPPAAVRQNNVATANVLDVARARGIRRIVYTSSKGVYGEIDGEHGPPGYAPIREDYRRKPTDLYGLLKVSCEDLGRYFRRVHGIEFIALRFATIYGPGRGVRHGTLSFYDRIVETARAGTPWVVAHGADQINDTVYVADVGRSIDLALTAPAPREWILNIGSGRPSTPRDFLAASARLFPRHRVEIGPGPIERGRSNPAYCRLDIAAARRSIGYEPAFDVVRGVEDYVRLLDRLEL